MSGRRRERIHSKNLTYQRSSFAESSTNLLTHRSLAPPRSSEIQDVPSALSFGDAASPNSTTDAKNVFEAEAEAAREFLTEAQPGLGGAVPAEMARSEYGAAEVMDLLGRIDRGVYT